MLDVIKLHYSFSTSYLQSCHIVYREKASDLRCWLEAYRYWNQGGLNNVKAMLQLVVHRYLVEQQLQDKQQQGASIIDETEKMELESLTLPELEVTPDIGLLHPLLDGYASNPKSCESNICIHSLSC